MDLISTKIEEATGEALEQIKLLTKLELSNTARAMALSAINIKLANEIQEQVYAKRNMSMYPSGGTVTEPAAKNVEKLVEEFISDKEHNFTEKQLNQLNKIWHMVCRASAESDYPMRVGAGLL